MYSDNHESFLIINEVRHGNISNVRLLNSWYGNEKSTHIMPFNSMADKKNSTELAKLKTTSHTFTAKITWEFKTENVITPGMSACYYHKEYKASCELRSMNCYEDRMKYCYSIYWSS